MLRVSTVARRPRERDSAAMEPHVVVAGGGIGALEALLALQALAGDRLRISLLCPSRHLTYRALSVAEPFGADPARRFEWDEITRDRGVRWIRDSVTGVRAEAREIDTRDGPPVSYDALLLALGARPQPPPAGAIPFAGPRDVLAVRAAIAALEPGRRHAIAFLATAATAWTLPLYELALMTAVHGRRRGLDLAIELVTAEPAPLGIFGREASAAVARRLEQAGIRLRTGAAPEAEADLTIALPRLAGPDVRGLPCEPGGFVPVDRYGRVRGADHVWAVGDMTARPLKQGGLAAQQADVAAADIAALVGGADVRVRPYNPTLRGLLLTGAEPVYLERRPHAPPESQASDEFLWWPAHKVAGRHVAPYLASLASDGDLGHADHGRAVQAP
jgi:sulfide:quinone oxidoreductase